MPLSRETSSRSFRSSESPLNSSNITRKRRETSPMASSAIFLEPLSSVSVELWSDVSDGSERNWVTMMSFLGAGIINIQSCHQVELSNWSSSTVDSSSLLLNVQSIDYWSDHSSFGNHQQLSISISTDLSSPWAFSSVRFWCSRCPLFPSSCQRSSASFDCNRRMECLSLENDFIQPLSLNPLESRSIFSSHLNECCSFRHSLFVVRVALLYALVTDRWRSNRSSQHHSWSAYTLLMLKRRSLPEPRYTLTTNRHVEKTR